MSEIKSTYYINNKEMMEVIKKYRNECENAKKLGLQKPIMPNYIGTKLLLLADGLAKRSNFYGYSWIEEMKLDAIENCIRYFNNFNPDKYDNPHTYFTTIMIRAFIRRIQSEKKQSELKQKMLTKLYSLNELEEVSSLVYDNIYKEIDNQEEQDKLPKKKAGRPKIKKGN